MPYQVVNQKIKEMETEPLLHILSTRSQLRDLLREVIQEIQPATAVDFTAEKMTVAEAAHYISISYASLIKWIADGRFRCHGTGRTRFLLRSELIEDYKKMKP